MPVRLYTIHGINTDGKWQETVESVFSPHFEEYTAIKYNHYNSKWFGATYAVFRILIDLGLFNKTARHVHGQYMKEDHAHHNFLIAHSWGTVLACYMSEKWDDVRFARVILLGAPLNRQFNFKEKFINSEFVCINECGGQDWVVDQAAKAAWIKIYKSPLKEYLGSAGKYGFIEGIEVHTLGKALERCGICFAPSSSHKAKIHNVPLTLFGHTDSTAVNTSDDVLIPDQVRIHARVLWLPFFWGLTPSVYRCFLDLCQEACEREGKKQMVSTNDLDNQLENLNLELMQNGDIITVGEYARKELEFRMKEHQIVLVADIASHVRFIIRKVRYLVADALASMSDASKVRMLEPRTAITGAAEEWLKYAKPGQA